MKNQTEGTNTENLGQNSSLDRDNKFGACRTGATTCIGDVKYVCRDGHWKRTGQFCPEDIDDK